MTNKNECKCCGDCCRDGVVISGIEALQLIGRKIVNPGFGCPFLQGNKCSVYDSRPMVCREYGPKKMGKISITIGLFEVCHYGSCRNFTNESFKYPEEKTMEHGLLYQTTGIVALSLSKDVHKNHLGFYMFQISSDENGRACLKQPKGFVGMEQFQKIIDASMRNDELKALLRERRGIDL